MRAGRVCYESTDRFWALRGPGGTPDLVLYGTKTATHRDLYRHLALATAF